MNTIIITTHKIEEWDTFKNHSSEIFHFDNENYEQISFDDGEREIIIVVGAEGNANTEIIGSLNAIASAKIVLYHQLNFNIEPKFNVSTVGEGLPNRPTYQSLLDARFEGEINTDIKRKAFDDVWKYFSEKHQKELLERINTDFLYSIYNGNTPTKFPKEVTPTDDINKLHKYFAEHNYDKQLDLDGDESIGAEQRKQLSLLRDALLVNK